MNKKLLIALAAAALFVSSNAAENEETVLETEVTETETNETNVETTEQTITEEDSGSGGNIIVTENAEIDLGAIEGGETEETGENEETEEITDEGGSGSGTIDGSGSGSGTIDIDTEALSGQVIVTSGAALVALAALLA